MEYLLEIILKLLICSSYYTVRFYHIWIVQMCQVWCQQLSVTISLKLNRQWNGLIDGHVL